MKSLRILSILVVGLFLAINSFANEAKADEQDNRDLAGVQDYTEEYRQKIKQTEVENHYESEKNRKDHEKWLRVLDRTR